MHSPWASGKSLSSPFAPLPKGAHTNAGALSLRLCPKVTANKLKRLSEDSEAAGTEQSPRSSRVKQLCRGCCSPRSDSPSTGHVVSGCTHMVTFPKLRLCHLTPCKNPSAIPPHPQDGTAGWSPQPVYGFLLPLGFALAIPLA